MPAHHQAYAQRSAESIMEWAKSLSSPEVLQVIHQILNNSKHPEMNLRNALGIQSLNRRHGLNRLTLACRKAMLMNCVEYRTIKNLLENGMEAIPLQSSEAQPPAETKFKSSFARANVRGGQYYH
jgi:hypothetical protein